MEILEFLTKNWQVITGIGTFIAYSAWVRFQIKSLLDFRKEDRLKLDNLELKVNKNEIDVTEELGEIKGSIREILAILRERDKNRREDKK